ncbi:hypothetical protein FACS1894156_3550 [Bacteroidia bacterium]|nr:hypothetical protein FACS1894156_3550 [Bacteroidia bacterium]
MMNKILNITTALFLVMGIIAVVLPLSIIAYIPLVAALLCAGISILVAPKNRQKIAAVQFIIALGMALILGVKVLFFE